MTSSTQLFVSHVIDPLTQSIKFQPPSTTTIIVGIISLLVLIIFLLITSGKKRRSNGLSPAQNRFIGSFCYFIAHSIVLFVCWKIWGTEMFEKSIFYMLHADAFMFVRIALISIKVWVY